MKIEDWHRKAADTISTIVNSNSRADKPTYSSEIAQLIASHAPANIAPKELVEKYAKQIRVRPFVGPDKHETIESILTRFASELKADTVEKVCLWSYAEMNVRYTLCGHSHCDGYDDPELEAMKYCYFCGGKRKDVTKEELAAALKKAKGRR